MYTTSERKEIDNICEKNFRIKSSVTCLKICKLIAHPIKNAKKIDISIDITYQPINLLKQENVDL